MNKNRLKKYAMILMCYLFATLIFYYIGGEQIKYKTLVGKVNEPIGVLTELNSTTSIEQTFVSDTETLDGIELYFLTDGRVQKGNLILSLENMQDNVVVANTVVNSSGINENGEFQWIFATGIEQAMNKQYKLTVQSECIRGEGPIAYYGSNDKIDNQILRVNDQNIDGLLCFSTIGKQYFVFGIYYWNIVVIGAILIIFYAWWGNHQYKKGKLTLEALITSVWERYGFLIKQLVSRDFKTKYKRSVLGYLWSLLNPLLTMAVQYIVFSTIFRSGIPNFPVYLLSGIILFNFFTEAVSQGLTAIVSNASLITKVYVPKYIYPVTKVISCSINLLISVIPLLIVTLLTGTKITKAVLLLPFALICLVLFCIGLSLLLSAAMVFFRDTQYLWGILSLVWMYATPLFYPENIVPARFKFIQTLNPIYHLIRFVRTILIDGVSPDPITYLYCLASAGLMCLIGAIIFKKFQDKFILYI